MSLTPVSWSNGEALTNSTVKLQAMQDNTLVIKNRIAPVCAMSTAVHVAGASHYSYILNWWVALGGVGHKMHTHAPYSTWSSTVAVVDRNNMVSDLSLSNRMCNCNVGYGAKYRGVIYIPEIYTRYSIYAELLSTYYGSTQYWYNFQLFLHTDQI